MKEKNIIRSISIVLILLCLLIGFCTSANAQVNGQKAQVQIKYVTSLPATCVPNQSLLYGVIGTPVAYYICTQTNTFADILSGGATSPGGSAKQVQFNNSGSFGGATGFEYQSGASPNVLITAQNANHVPLQIKLAASQVGVPLEVRDSASTLLFSVTTSGGFSAGGDSTFSLNGTNTTFPRKVSLSNIGAGTAFRQEYESEGTAIAVREAGKFQLFSRYGIKIVGSRNSTTAASFETGSSTDPAVFIENGNTGAIPLRVNGLSGTTTNLFEVQSNAGTLFGFNGNFLSLSPFGASAGNTLPIRFLELAANGTNYVGIKAPDSITSDINFTLPVALPGTNGQPLLSSTGGVLSFPTGTPDGTKFLRDDGTWQVPSGGGGGANTALSNLSGVAISDGDGTANLATGANINLALSATAPAATTGASQAGKTASISASNAVASTDTAGAAAGGNSSVIAGDAARFTSGNANGGSVIFIDGAGIGTGVRGGFNFGGTSSTDVKLIKFSNGYSAPSLSMQTGAGADSLGSFHSGTASYGVAGSGGLLEGVFVGASGGRWTLAGGVYGFASTSASGIATLDGNRDVGITRKAANVLRITGASDTGAGSLVIGTSTVGSIGTSGVGVFAIANGTAPTSSPADEFQLYSADSAAGKANAFIRNEAGEVNRISGLSRVLFVQEDATTDTVLTDITGFSHDVETGRSYGFEVTLFTTSNSSGGVKFSMGGTATPNFIIYQARVEEGTSIVANTRATALGTTVGGVTAVTAAWVRISGTIDVTTGGTLTVQFAQNASNASASSVLVGSRFTLIPID